jgi:hypothetical protein
MVTKAGIVIRRIVSLSPIKNIVNNQAPSKTVTITNVSPATANIRSVDYGNATNERVGGTTMITVTPATRSGGGSSRAITTTTSTAPTSIVKELSKAINKPNSNLLRTSLSRSSINALARKLNVSSSTIRKAKIQQRNNNTSIIKTTSGNYVISKESLNPNTGRPYGMISAVERQKGLAGVQQRSYEKLRNLSAERERTTSKNQKTLAQAYKRELAIAGTTALGVGASAISGFIKLPRNLVTLATNPKMIVKGIKNLPKSIKAGGENFGQILKTSPTQGLAKIGGEILVLKGTGSALKVTGKLGTKAFNKINPKFVGVKKGKINIKVAKETFKVSGKNKYLKRRVLKVTLKKPITIIDKLKGRKPGQFAKFQKTGGVKLRVVGKIPTMSLRKQTSLAGKRITAISSQQNRLLTIIRRNKLIRKPIPNEATFSNSIKNNLKRFDKGLLNKKQIINLNTQIKKTGSKGLLERSFFLDPSRNIRPSRLGLTNERPANFMDYIADDITFKRGKPQILLFQDLKVSKFPNYLKNVKKKLNKNSPLSKSEADQLLNWQLKNSGKAKPVGFITKEAEVTIAPTEIIKRGRKIATTNIRGRNVNIISASIKKPTKITSTLLKKANSGKITKKELSKLKNRLQKETGFKYSSSSSLPKVGKYVNIKRIGLSTALSGVKYKGRFITSKIPTYKPTSGLSKVSGGSKVTYKRTPTYKVTPRTTPRYSTTSKVTYKPTGSSRVRTTIRNVIRPTTPSKGSKKKILSSTSRKSMSLFIPYAKQGNRYIRLSKLPLKRNDALSRASYVADNTVSATIKLKPIGRAKRVGVLKSFEKGYFNKKHQKFRGFKIKKGNRYQLTNKAIEKRKFRIDTGGESRGLSVYKFLKRKRLR